jgi:hypothetical protein
MLLGCWFGCLDWSLHDLHEGVSLHLICFLYNNSNINLLLSLLWNKKVVDGLANDWWIKDICHNLTAELLTGFFNLWVQIWMYLTKARSFGCQPRQALSKKNLVRLLFGQICLWASARRNGEIACCHQYLEALGPSKCKFFTWLLLQNRLWMVDRLLQCGWANSYFCPLCEWKNLLKGC